MGKSSLLAIIVLFLPVVRSLLSANSYPSNEYEYSFNRDALLAAEAQFEHRDSQLTPREQTVDRYLQYLKWREFKATKDSGFPPSSPIEEKLAYIQTTEIYKALVKFPKGGNMHSHEEHDISKGILLDIVWSSSDFQHLYMLPPDHPTAPWTLDFFINPPNDSPAWINVKNSTYSKEQILKYQTLLGILTYNATRYPTDSGMRWKEINVLWGRGSTQLVANINVKKKYILALYEVGLSQGVIYFETRKSMGLFDRIYELDPSSNYTSTNGKKFLDQGGDLDVQIAQNASKEFAKTHPEFVGHKRIIYSFRQNPLDVFEDEVLNVVRLNQLYPDHILGFDAVGEEDAGYSHLHYLGEFLKLYNSGSKASNVPLYLHSSETNWPDDLAAASLNLDDDLVATIMNSYDTLLLNAKRIGHGYGYIKHPYLLSLIRDRGIPIETCVVSNQLLGFSPDIRNHPGLHYYRSGVIVMLGSDDAGTFGYDNFTVDWYEAFMAWGLDLRDLRTFALNSLNYSGLSETDKKDAIDNKWKPMWDKYIADTYSTACARNYIAEAANENRTTTFAGILPKEGAKKGSTKVHIFGRNFEQGICKNVTCRFGDKVSTAAVYVSNQHIVCESPDFGDQKERTVSLSVALDGGTYVPTGLNFTYKYDAITTPPINRATGAIISGLWRIVTVVSAFILSFSVM